MKLMEYVEESYENARPVLYLSGHIYSSTFCRLTLFPLCVLQYLQENNRLFQSVISPSFDLETI